MKGDFSRITFNPRRHYAGVLTQQGRVHTDNDDNEQWFIGEHRIATTGTDVVGSCGAPIHDAGFEISVKDKSLVIGAGRYYVDGILVENHEQEMYEGQPHLPNPTELAKIFEQAKTNRGIAYLDVWHRHITALDDPRIREVALGGPDTTTRVQVIWQVRVLPVQVTGEDDSAECERLRKRLSGLESELEKLKEQNAPADQIEALEKQIEDLSAAIAERCSGNFSCDTNFEEWDKLNAARNVTLNARTQPPGDDDDVCLIPPSAGYQRLENQLYRVEIHAGGTIGSDKVTFKASRDNGTVVTLIEKISGQDVTVRDVGPDDVLGFANGQFVEVIDDELELKGTPGEIIQIDSVDPGTRVIRIKSAPSRPFNAALHPKLRRWDTAGALDVTGDWLKLEGGIVVQFSEGEYRTGDFWLIPARTATGEIEWPPFEVPNTAPEPQPPLGIGHHYCKLALVGVNDGELQLFEDCRNLFPPLTELAEGLKPAIHIVGTSWGNDDLFDLEEFFKVGLQVRFDGAPDPRSMDEVNFIVTLEVLSAGDDATSGLSALVLLRGDVIRNFGDATLITWRPKPNLRETLTQFLDRNVTLRIRITLQGHTIWSEQGKTRRYMDGQAFGVPLVGGRAKKSRIGLQFPSGESARASDFESWFYLGRDVPQPAPPLQVRRVTFITVTGAPATDGVVNVPPIPDQVLFKASEQVNVIEIEFNRPVLDQGFGPNSPEQCILVEVILRNRATPVPATKLAQPNLVIFALQDQQQFRGTFRLTALGIERPGGIPVRAADDGAILDGNYDTEPGVDFVLNFRGA